MHIKLLSNVLHDGQMLPAGLIAQNVPDDIALSFIASGVAQEVEEILDVPPAPPAAIPNQTVVDQAPATAASVTLDSSPAASEPTPGAPPQVPAEPAPAAAESKTAEVEPKPAKAKDGK